MNKKVLMFLGISFVIIVLDLFTKSLAEKYLADKTIEVIPGLFNLVLVWNKGAAFGMLAQAPETIRKLILVGSSIIAAVITAGYVFKSNAKLSN
jgi:Lipoprotein signal peptidase